MSVDIVDLHARVLDDVARSDAVRAAGGERQWIRGFVPHELCPPGPTCLIFPAANLVVVTVLGDGIRIRMPIAVPEAAA